VFALPESMRPSLRSTNLLERAFRELRRQLRPIGCLSGRHSADRIPYGRVVRLNDPISKHPLTGVNA
jgi:transposase-like protein